MLGNAVELGTLLGVFNVIQLTAFNGCIGLPGSLILDQKLVKALLKVLEVNHRCRLWFLIKLLLSVLHLQDFHSRVAHYRGLPPLLLFSCSFLVLLPSSFLDFAGLVRTEGVIDENVEHFTALACSDNATSLDWQLWRELSSILGADAALLLDGGLFLDLGTGHHAG